MEATVLITFEKSPAIALAREAATRCQYADPGGFVLLVNMKTVSTEGIRDRLAVQLPPATKKVRFFIIGLRGVETAMMINYVSDLHLKGALPTFEIAGVFVLSPTEVKDVLIARIIFQGNVEVPICTEQEAFLLLISQKVTVH